MPTPRGRANLNRSVVGIRRDVTEMFRIASEQMRGILTSPQYIDVEGNILPQYHEEIKSRCGAVVQALFTTGRNDRHAYAVDGVSALTPFAAILNKWYAYAVFRAVRHQHNLLRQQAPEDVFNWLASQPARNTVSEQEDVFAGQWVDFLRIFRRDPFAPVDPARRWVPMHRWTDNNGYRLSDRIWQTGFRTRLKIDQMLTEGLNEGMSSLQLSRRLEQFLIPGRAPIRTKKPYGTDASFDAMRLARTEIARAANAASYNAAYLNPYVNGYEVHRSRNGDPTCPICPRHATIGISGERLREPYGIEDGSLPPWHPNCLCYEAPIAEDRKTTTERLRQIMQNPPQTAPSVNPSQMDQLLAYFLGGLTGLLLSEFSSEELF